MKLAVNSGILIPLLVGALQSVLQAGPLQNWAWRGSFPSGEGINGVGFGQGRFVAVCNDGTIMTSTNNRDWEQVASPTRRPLNGVGYGNGRFVAVGHQAILTSINGQDWVDRSAGIDLPLSSVAFGNGVFVAVGFFGAIYLSTNGIDWTQQIPGPEAGLVSNLPGITFMDGQFFAAGVLGIISSPDGEHWTNRYAGGRFSSITHGNGVLVAVGDPQSNTNNVRYSTDGGVSWLPATAGTNGLRLRSVTHGPAGFVSITMDGMMLVSSDARAWSQSAISTPQWLTLATTYGDGTYVVGGGSVGSSLWISSNAVDWVRLDHPSALAAVAFGNGRHVAVGVDSDSYTSADGVTWTRHDHNQRLLAQCLAFGNGTFVAAGDAGSIFTSSDGAQWTAQGAGSNLHFSGVAYGLNTFVMAGTQGTILTSSNAVDWQLRPRILNTDFTDIGWNGSEFVAVTRQGNVLRSSDLAHWTSRPVAISSSTNLYPLSGVSCGNGLYVVVGQHIRWMFDFGVSEAIVGVSSNAVDWSVLSFPLLSGLSRVTFAHGAFVAIGARGVMLASTNGTLWTECNTGTQRHLAGICYGKGRFVAVGPQSSILQSGFHGPPVIANALMTSAGMRLELGAGPNQYCWLQYSDSLTPPNWRNLREFVSAEEAFQFTDEPVADLQHRFYRVVTP